MAHVSEAPRGWGAQPVILPPASRTVPILGAPSARYPATHELAKGLQNLDPEAMVFFDLTWPGISNPNAQATVRVMAEFNLWRSGGGINLITRPVMVVNLMPGLVDAAGDKQEATLPGGEVVSGHTDIKDVAAGLQTTLQASIAVWHWLPEDYGLDAVLWWVNPATNSWAKLDSTFHQWRIPWVTLRKAIAAVSAPQALQSPSVRFSSL